MGRKRRGRSRQAATSCGSLLSATPAPWLALLVAQHLGSKELLALFQTCKELAELVVQHCKALKLHPNAALRQGSRRAAVLNLASGCNNVHLHLHRNMYTFPLDLPAVWQCITQLTLVEVGLTLQHISNQHLEQLVQLHTLCFEKYDSYGSSMVDYEAMQQLTAILQSGGLRCLNTLQVIGGRSSIGSFAPGLGSHITKVVVDSAGRYGQDDFSKLAQRWPALQELQIVPFAWVNPVAQNPKILNDLLSHPNLKRVTVPPGCLECWADEVQAFYTQGAYAPAWELLNLTEVVTVWQLCHMPLKHVKKLQITQGIRDSLSFGVNAEGNARSANAGLANMQHCDTVELIPRAVVYKSASARGTLGSKPIFQLPFYPELMSFLMLQNTAMKAALILVNPTSSFSESCMHLSQKHLDALPYIPQGVHTLVCIGWKPVTGFSWSQILASIPSHVHSMVLQDCFLSADNVHTQFECPAPPGLSSLVLAVRRPDREWVNDLQGHLTQFAFQWPDVCMAVADEWYLPPAHEMQLHMTR